MFDGDDSDMAAPLVTTYAAIVATSTEYLADVHAELGLHQARPLIARGIACEAFCIGDNVDVCELGYVEGGVVGGMGGISMGSGSMDSDVAVMDVDCCEDIGTGDIDVRLA